MLSGLFTLGMDSRLRALLTCSLQIVSCRLLNWHLLGDLRDQTQRQQQSCFFVITMLMAAKAETDPVPALRQEKANLVQLLDSALERELALLSEVYNLREEVR